MCSCSASWPAGLCACMRNCSSLIGSISWSKEQYALAEVDEEWSLACRVDLTRSLTPASRPLLSPQSLALRLLACAVAFASLTLLRPLSPTHLTALLSSPTCVFCMKPCQRYNTQIPLLFATYSCKSSFHYQKHHANACCWTCSTPTFLSLHFPTLLLRKLTHNLDLLLSFPFLEASCKTFSLLTTSKKSCFSSSHNRCSTPSCTLQ